MKPQHLIIKDFSDFRSVIRGYRPHKGLGWIYRGQSNSDWELLSKAGREEFYRPDQGDLGRFNDWKSKAIAYYDLPTNEWECLALAQHFGLATRLLDWTLNPLVALFFAVEKDFEKSGSVFIYSPKCYIDKDIANVNELANIPTQSDDSDSYIAYLPRAINSRLINQQGVFTYHRKPNEPMVVLPWNLDETHPNLFCVDIPKENKEGLLLELMDYGINYSYLFPDLDGLSLSINFETKQFISEAKKYFKKS